MSDSFSPFTLSYRFNSVFKLRSFFLNLFNYFLILFIIFERSYLVGAYYGAFKKLFLSSSIYLSAFKS